jgi:chromosome segregation ATPase
MEDPRFNKVNSRINFLDDKSQDDYHRIKHTISTLEEDKKVYDTHLDHLSKQLNEFKESITELKHLMNQTVRLLRRTASNADVKQLQNRADKIDFATLLKREEFKELVEEI